MTIKTKTKKKQPFVPIVITTYDQEDETSEWKGFKLNETYELRYKMANTGREMSLKKFNGWEMMQCVSEAMNFALTERKEFLDSKGISVDYWMRKASQRLLTLYATAKLDEKRFLETSKNMAKDDLDLILVKRALKNNAKGRDALSVILSNASVYFYCLNEMEREGDYSKTFSCITVEDRFGDAFPKDYELEFISENQKRQLMTINGWETDEDINNFMRKEGVLEFAFKECA